jgi:hypothetical protein
VRMVQICVAANIRDTMASMVITSRVFAMVLVIMIYREKVIFEAMSGLR